MYVFDKSGISNYSLSLGCLFFIFITRILIDNLHHLLLDCLLFEQQPIFVPDEIWRLVIKTFVLQAALEQSDNVAVIRVLSEAESAAIVHELPNLIGLLLTKIIDGRFLLFLFDIRVLLSLRAPGEALPGKRSFQKVENDVTNGLEVVSSRLLVPKVGVQTRISGSAR